MLSCKRGSLYALRKSCVRLPARCLLCALSTVSNLIPTTLTLSLTLNLTLNLPPKPNPNPNPIPIPKFQSN